MATDKVTFLGTAGARVMVANQILASGGLWFDLGGTQILFDPGPGTLVRGMTMWRAKPWEVTSRLSSETGIRVIAARDDMTFDLA